MEEKYCNKELATISATNILKTEEWVFFPTSLGQRIAKIRVRRVPVEIEVEWLVAAILKAISKEIKIVQTTMTQRLNWWGFGLELLLVTSEGRYKICLK